MSPEHKKVTVPSLWGWRPASRAQTAPTQTVDQHTHAALSMHISSEPPICYETRSPPSLSRPSLTLPTRQFSLMPYRCARSPLSQRSHLWHLMISAALVQSHLKCHPRCWVIVTLTSTALDTLAESALLRLLIWLALDLGQDERAI